MSPPVPGYPAGSGASSATGRGTNAAAPGNNSNGGGGGGAERSAGSSKTKDYSPNLGSIDSQAPVSPNSGATWDTETDHLLSFFLGGGDAPMTMMTGNHGQLPDFASSAGGGSSAQPPAVGPAGGSGGDGGVVGALMRGQQQQQGRQGMRNQQQKYTSTGASNRQQMDDDDDDVDDDDPAPPTPALNFYGAPSSSSTTHYHHHGGGPGGSSSMMMMSHNHPGGGGGGETNLPGTALTSSSSSSSLSSSAAVLATAAGGGTAMYHTIQQHPRSMHYHQPQMQHLQQQQQQRNQSPIEHSPISPAALIGHGHENLMLPPASRPPAAESEGSGPADGSSQQQQQKLVATGPIPDAKSLQSASAAASSMSEKERHIAWLRDLNEMAKVAISGGGGANSGPDGAPFAPQQQQQQQQRVAGKSGGGAPQPMPPPGSMHAAFPGHGAVLVPNAMMYPPGTAAAMLMHPHTVQSMAASKPPVESAEKRAKRLERNRESARKSRRRKKERLATLEAQVNEMHGKIDAERRVQVNAMVPAFQRMRQCATTAGDVQEMIRSTSPNGETAKAVLDFQHSALKQIILPRYHKLLLWFTLQNESFFFVGKEKYASSESNKATRLTTTKISSKQIGDELTNGTKNEKGGGSKRRVTFKDNKEEGGGGDDDENSRRPNLTPYANDAARVWPLFCYEMTFSVDQEERFVATHKKMQDLEGLANSRSQIIAAVRTGDSLKEAVESLSGVLALREERTSGANGILSAGQLSTYRNWLCLNRERCSSILQRRGSAIADKPSPLTSTEASLHEICRRLNEVLQISKSPEK